MMKRLINMRRRNEKGCGMGESFDRPAPTDLPRGPSSVSPAEARLIEEAGAEVSDRIDEFTSRFAADIATRLAKNTP
jgi:hypothetical protein